MSRAAQFNRPVEYDPSLLHQQSSSQGPTARFGRSGSLTKEQAMKDEFGFDGEEEQKQTNDAQSEVSHSRIRNVAEAEDELGTSHFTPISLSTVRCSSSNSFH